MNKFLLILAVIVSGCTTINIKTVDYCHNEDGTYRTDDPRCTKNLNPIEFQYDTDHNLIRK